MMLRPKGQGGALRASVLGLATLALVALACEAPEPTGELMVTSPVYTELPPDAFAPFTPEMERPELTNVSAVARALEESYPPLLRDAGIGGSAHVTFWIDRAGDVIRYEVAESSGYPALDQAAVKVAGTMIFTPARKDGSPVPVVVRIPITFRVGGAEARSEASG